jgi:LuxR family maltose regulon positive regulatory protein
MAKPAAARGSAYNYAHKLFAPPAYQGAVNRESLLRRILDEAGAPVVLFQAPAGHGKSTLLQQVKAECRARGVQTGWFTADEADNDFRRFLMHLQALLASIGGGPAKTRPARAGANPEPPERMAEDAGSRSDWFVSRLLDFDGPVALFFDDVQALSTRSVLSFFKELIEHLPEHVQIFIASRTVPDIGLARWVVNNQALVLRPDDLRFSQDEVRRFFADARDLQIQEDEIEAIYRQTEGWPAALQLFRLSLASPAVRSSLRDLASFRPRDLADYLTDNVLALQPPEVQDFLLQTAPLTRLSGPLCDAVLGRKDSQAVLQRLEKSGLFVRGLDPELRWFKYHAMFAAILQEQLREQSVAAEKAIHGRAARWFLEHGHHEEAIHHATEAGDYALAADILDAWASRLIPIAHLVTVERWYEQLPLDEIEKRPDLLVKVAWALCFLRRHQKLKPVRSLLRRLRQASGTRETNPVVVRAMLAVLDDDLVGCSELVREIEIRGQDVEGFRAFELGAAANLCGYLAIAAGDLEGAREHLALARAHGDRGESPFSLGYSVSTAGMNLLIQGSLGEALQRFRLAGADAPLSLESSVAAASQVACYIQALYEANDLDAAETQFEQCREMIANSAMLDYFAVAYVTMARIHDSRNRPAQALDILDEAENIGHIGLWPRLVRIIAWERVRRFLVRGEIDRARAAASHIERDEALTPPGWLTFAEDAEGEVLGEARLALHSGRPDDAIRLITPELGLAQKQGRVRRQIKLLVLEALAYQARGQENPAHRSLQKALQLAAPGPYLRSFLDEGPQLIPMLQAEYRAVAAARDGVQTPREFIARLLDASGAERKEAQTLGQFQALEPLTEREKTILVLLANGVSNEELAGRVFVSKNTIKFHLKNIYSKLAVRSRLQAINAARQMGLIR